jgi:hypothetical protein
MVLNARPHIIPIQPNICSLSDGQNGLNPSMLCPSKDLSVRDLGIALVEGLASSIPATLRFAMKLASAL